MNLLKELTTLLEAQVPGPRKATHGSDWSKAPHYDAERKHVGGHVADWMDKIGVTDTDLAEARRLVMKLDSYKDLIAMTSDITSRNQKRFGLFAFDRKSEGRITRYANKHMYTVAANGQIRYDGSSRGKLSSPKPRLIAGDTVKSLVSIYDHAFKALSGIVKKNLEKHNVT